MMEEIKPEHSALLQHLREARRVLGIVLALASFGSPQACREAPPGFTQSAVGVTVQSEASFGEGYVGIPLQTTIQVEATTSLAIKLAGVMVDHPDIVVEPPSENLTVQPQSPHQILLTWLPSEPGQLHASARVFTNVADGKQAWVSLSGYAQAVPNCDDGDPCTVDSFDFAAETCSHVVVENLPCDDGNACSVNGRCIQGECRSEWLDCDDGIDCTLDGCDAGVGCVHVPQHSACSDGDPCTLNVCEREQGCSNPRAPTGTVCGEVDCAKAHVCNPFGSCVELNISGTSDGFPCSDGDPCTVGDQCQGGACQAGLALPDTPQIVARFPTYGGSGSRLAQQGDTLVFATSGRIDMVTIEDGTLVHQSRLPMPEKVWPIASTIEPLFYLLGSSGRMWLLDASDATLGWSIDMEAPSRGDLMYDHVEAVVFDAAVLSHGAVAAVAFAYMHSGVVLEVDHVLVFASFSVDPPALSYLWQVEAPFLDLATWQDTLVVAHASGVTVLQADAAGETSAVFDMPLNAQQVAVEASRLVLVDHDTMFMLELEGAEYQLVDTYILPWSVDDILLFDESLLLAAMGQPAGIVAMTFAGEGYMLTLVDSMAAGKLQRDEQHLHITGELAVPAILGATWDLQKLTGPGHGEVQSVVRGNEGTALLVGNTHWGALPLHDSIDWVDWHLRWGSTRQAPLFVRGHGDTVVLPTFMDVDATPWTSDCTGYAGERLELGSGVGQFVLCGLHAGARLAAAGERLWALTPAHQDDDAWALRAWAIFDDGLLQPVIDASGVAESAGQAVLASLDEGNYLALLEPATDEQDALTISLFESAFASLDEPRIRTFPCQPEQQCSNISERRVLASAAQLFWSSSRTISVFNMSDLQTEVTRLVFDDADSHPPALWSQHSGRTWATWHDALGGTILSQLQSVDGELLVVGDMALPEPLRALKDMGARVAGATNSEVLVLAPACF